MAINLNALKDIQSDLDNRGDKTYLYTKEFKEETDIRVLPPTARLNGIFFREVMVWWINKKAYISPVTFREPCPIEAEIEQAKRHAQATNDKELSMLLNKKETLQRKAQFEMPVLVMKQESNEVQDGKARILVCGASVVKGINTLVTGRQYQNNTPDGALDRVKGYTMIVGKTGSGIDTEYKVTSYLTPSEIDISYYKNIPDIEAHVRSRAKTDDYLIGVIRNYLYGEPMPNEENSNRYGEEPLTAPAASLEDSSEDRTVVNTPPPPATGRRGNSAPPPATGSGRSTPPPPANNNAAVGNTPPPTGGTRRRNVVDDLNNIGDD